MVALCDFPHAWAGPLADDLHLDNGAMELTAPAAALGCARLGAPNKSASSVVISSVRKTITMPIGYHVWRVHARRRNGSLVLMRTQHQVHCQ